MSDPTPFPKGKPKPLPCRACGEVFDAPPRRRYCSPECKKAGNPNSVIRSLRPGEVPVGEPRRLKNAQGYVRLRWRVGVREYAEVYEHRWVMGVDDPAVHVHHINGIKDDNRPENLEVVTAAEHGGRHRQVNWEEVVALYATGISTPEVARRIGIEPSTVFRVLTEMGVEIRPGWQYHLREVDTDAIRRLHAAGVRSRRIAKALGCSPSLVDKHVMRMGLPPHPEGRPTAAQIAAAEAALNDYREEAAA